MKPALFVLLAVGLLTSRLPAKTEPAGLPFDLRLTAAAAWAENVSRSSSPLDWADAMSYEAALTASHHRQLAPNLTGQFWLQAGVFTRPRYDENNEITLGPGAGLSRKFGLGPLAPVVSAEAGFVHKAARIGGNTGWTARAALTASKRLHPAWRLSATGDWHNHYARSSTYDVRYQRLFGELAWDFTDRWQLTYGYGRLWGDFTANASPVIWPRAIGGLLGPVIADYYNAMPWEVTDAYGPGWVTYRVYGKARLWWLQLSPALTANTALALRYDSQFAINKVNVRYRTDIWTLSLLHSF